TLRTEMLGGWRIVALTVGIHLQLQDQRPRFLDIGIESALSRPNILRRRTKDEVPVSFHVWIVRAQDEKFASFALIGTGLTDVCKRSLPKIQNAPSNCSRWNFNDQRSRLGQIGKPHNVWGGGVGGQNAKLVLEGSREKHGAKPVQFGVPPTYF